MSHKSKEVSAMATLPRECITAASANCWTTRGIVVLVAWFGFGILTALVNVARPRHESRAGAADYGFWSCLVASIACAGATAVVIMEARVTQAAEIKLGYSTLVYQKSPVDVFDETTGKGIRRAEEPALARKSDLVAARAWAVNEADDDGAQ